VRRPLVGLPDFKSKKAVYQKANDFMVFFDFIGFFFEESSWEMLGDLRKKWVRRSQNKHSFGYLFHRQLLRGRQFSDLRITSGKSVTFWFIGGRILYAATGCQRS
jgi:hypothetical protein